MLLIPNPWYYAFGTGYTSCCTIVMLAIQVMGCLVPVQLFLTRLACLATLQAWHLLMCSNTLLRQMGREIHFLLFVYHSNCIYLYQILGYIGHHLIFFHSHSCNPMFNILFIVVIIIVDPHINQFTTKLSKILTLFWLIQHACPN